MSTGMNVGMRSDPLALSRMNQGPKRRMSIQTPGDLKRPMDTSFGVPTLAEMREQAATSPPAKRPSSAGSSKDVLHNFAVGRFLAQEMRDRMLEADYLGAPNVSKGPWGHLQHDTIRQGAANEAIADSQRNQERAALMFDEPEMDPRKQGSQALEAKAHQCYDMSIAIEELAKRNGYEAHSVGTVESDLPRPNHGFTVIGDLSGVDFSKPMKEWPKHLVICDMWGGLGIVCAPDRYENIFDSKMTTWKDLNVKVNTGGSNWVDPDNADWKKGATSGPFALARPPADPPTA
jgi:hypothetical protein